ncbi:MAG: TfoX/Sxy family protein [Planctomycetales bacterium]|nr:TfoX/Sxy family protein [Planctomycetales bacterium]
MTDEDQVLAARIRSLLKRREGYSEKKMFGGIGFFIDGNMCVGPWKGSLIVRLDKACHEQTQAEPHVGPMDITGKVMRGWARIEPAGIDDDAALKAWVDRAVRYVRTLPAKTMPPQAASRKTTPPKNRS